MRLLGLGALVALLAGGVLAAGPPAVGPVAKTDRERAVALYTSACAGCHGPRGSGDGPEGLLLRPPPRSFRDPAFMEGFSPARGFHRITEGLGGTAMASHGGLARAERWSLAFYVAGLRHDPAAVARGGARFAAGPTSIDRSLGHLAGATDGDLLAELGKAGLDPAAAADVLAYLRAEAPWNEIIAR